MKKKEIAKKWLGEKKAYQVFSMRKSHIELCQRDIQIFSFLAFRTKKNQVTEISFIKSVFGFDYNAIKKSLNLLRLMDLVTLDGKTACEPSGNIRDLFVLIDHKGDHWYDKYAKYPVFLLNKCKKKSGKEGKETKSILTFSENNLYWLLFSLAESKVNESFVGEFIEKKNQTQSGLRTLLFLSEKGIRNSVNRLVELGLISKVGGGFRIYKPKDPSFWLDKKVKSPPNKEKERQEKEEKSCSAKKNISDFIKTKRKDIDSDLMNVTDSIANRIINKAGISRTGKEFNQLVEIFQMIFDRYHYKDLTGESTLFGFISFRLEELFAEALEEDTFGTPLHLFGHKVKQALIA